MWKLITADSEYNRVFNYVQWPLLAIAVLANSVFGDLEEVVAALMLLLGFFIGAMTGAESLKTKRIRLLSGLPLPVRTLGMARFYGVVVGWFIYMALLALSSLISQRGHLGPEYLWWILTKIGSLFVLSACFALAKDWFYCLKDRKLDKSLVRWVANPILTVAGAVGGPLLYMYTLAGPGVYRGHFFLVKISETFLSVFGAMGIFLLGLGLLALDVFVYERRRSYAEDSGWPY